MMYKAIAILAAFLTACSPASLSDTVYHPSNEDLFYKIKGKKHFAVYAESDTYANAQSLLNARRKFFYDDKSCRKPIEVKSDASDENGTHLIIEITCS